MLQMLTKPFPDRLPLWAYLETELQKTNAFLLPLRLFIGLGWLRAGVEKMLDPLWASGIKMPLFFHAQLAADAVPFPFYETLITQLFESHAFVLSWVVLIGELLAGMAILTGTLTNLALLGGLFMNLNFVLAGVVNPSAFYIVIQGALLSGGARATFGGDTILASYRRSLAIAAPPSPARGSRSWGKWIVLMSSVLYSAAATLVVPYIRDFGPNGVHDPAMLLFILLVLGTVLMSIHYVQMAAE